MDARTFGKAYAALPELNAPSNAERRELVKAPRQWMGYFTGVLSDFLIDGKQPPKERFLEETQTYQSWACHTVEKTYNTLQHMSLTAPHETRHIEQEMNFHRLNRSMAGLWRNLFYECDAPATPLSLSRVQIHLASFAIPAIRRLAFLNRNHDNIMHPNDESRELIGHLNEVDVAITTLELTKQHPHIITLPAPNQYERNAVKTLNRNADFIVVDKNEGQVRGLQVKGSASSSHNVRHYDPDYVTVVDGASDLGNMTFNERHQLIERFPGQIALSILSDAPLKGAPAFIDKQLWMYNRQVAKELLHGRKSQLPAATKHVGYHLLHDLYRQPSKSQVSA